jgi:hypothetical protein
MRRRQLMVTGALLLMAGSGVVFHTESMAADQGAGSDKSGTVPSYGNARNKAEAQDRVKADASHVKQADRTDAKLMRVSDLFNWAIIDNPKPDTWPKDAYVWVVKVEGATRQIFTDKESAWMVRIFGGTTEQPLFASYTGDEKTVPGWDAMPDHDPNG